MPPPAAADLLFSWWCVLLGIFICLPSCLWYDLCAPRIEPMWGVLLWNSTRFVLCCVSKWVFLEEKLFRHHLPVAGPRTCKTYKDWLAGFDDPTGEALPVWTNPPNPHRPLGSMCPPISSLWSQLHGWQADSPSATFAAPIGRDPGCLSGDSLWSQTHRPSVCL